MVGVCHKESDLCRRVILNNVSSSLFRDHRTDNRDQIGNANDQQKAQQHASKEAGKEISGSAVAFPHFDPIDEILVLLAPIDLR